MLKILNDRWHLALCEDHQAAVRYAVEHWLACAREAVAHHGAFFVALSGGSTPKAIFQALVRSPFKELVPWKHIHLFWSDERSVSPNHSDSNYKMALDAGLKEMPIPENQIHRMIAEENIEENALAYEAAIHRVLGINPFDLIMLGMGEDGHTASLFPHTEALHIHNRSIVANYIPQKGTWRMTMTYPCINSARHIALYVLGSSKKEIVPKIIQGVLQGKETPNAYPIQRIGVPSHHALWILDQEAASQLVL
jgi:6-phosphogluconolactonase